ncbi:uncharacterized protein C12orf56-like [Corticium candelabrum]|uniref:uncharacterized protein C12orf56-like n=1 Tax=Corticium candelabrum TaxID=121492 RepID=UPI002E26D9E9|nr:uncharacterized protein C12orf56-like [Corticium candelabrum]
MRRQNTRLESFLKRTLDAEEYDRLRCYESVIVVSADENRAFKYVVLGHRVLYLSENPPKVLRAALDLGDVEEIVMVQDFPAFLSGAERENTQHIRIKYRQSICDSHSPTSRTTSRKSIQSSPHRLAHKSPRPLPHIENSSRPRQQSTSDFIPTNSLAVGPTDSPLTSKTNDVNESSRCLLDSKKSPDTKSLMGSKSEFVRSTSTPLFPNAVYQEKSGGSTPIVLSPLNSPGSRKHSRSQTTFDAVVSSVAASVSLPLGRSVSVSADLPFGDDELFETKLGGKSVGVNSRVSHSMSLDSLHQVSSPQAISLKGKLLIENLLSWKGSGLLHLYVLSKESPFFMNLKAALLNYNMESTLHHTRQASSPLLQQSPTRNEISNAVLFHQMTHELLTATSIERKAQLLQELKTSCDRVYSLKRYFWKTSELLEFLVHQMDDNVAALLQTCDECKRADELEFAVVVLQAIASVFRETEVLDNRAVVLTNKKEPLLSRLVALLVKYTDPTVTMQKGGTKIRKKANDDEIHELVEELSDCVITVLFELFVAAQQMTWLFDISSGFNICWIAGCIEGSQNTQSVVDCLMKRTTRTLGLMHLKSVVPATQAVLLYQQLYVIKIILQYTQTTASYMRATYAEEFRYYFQDPAIGRRLPSEYSLTLPSLRLVSEIVGRAFHSTSSRTGSIQSVGSY